MPLDPQLVESATRQYDRERDRYLKLARIVEAECQKLIRTGRILATVQSRAKSPDSFELKLLGYLAQGKQDKVQEVQFEDDAIASVGDLAGVRIATYVESDRQRVVELVQSHFRIAPNHDGDPDIEEHDKASGYRATHLQVLLPPELLNRPDTSNIRETPCEIQVCSMLAHVWNEVEHDIRYKDAEAAKSEPLIGSELDDLLTDAKRGDGHIEQLLVLHSSVRAEGLVDEIAVAFPHCGAFTSNAREVLTEVVRLGYDTADVIADELLTDERLSHAEKWAEVVNEALDASDESTRLDPDTADLLLAVLLHEHGRDVRAVHLKELKDGSALRVARVAQVCIDQGVFN